MRLRRFEKCGATFTEDLSSLAYCRQKFTVNSSPVQTTMRGKGALQFDGVDDYVDIGKQIVNKDIGSIAVWFKLLNYRETDPDLFFGCSLTTTQHLYLGVNGYSKKLGFGIGNLGTGDWGQSLVIELDTLYFVVVSWNSGTAKLYINGNLVQTKTYSGEAAIYHKFPIGCYFDAENLYDFHSSSIIQDFMYFPFVLTDEDVQALYKGTVFDYEKDLVSEWDMSEPYQKDSGWKEYENDGTPTSISASNVKRMGAGKLGIEFDGSNACINCGSNINLANKDFSILAEAKTNSFSTIQVLLGLGTLETGKGLHCQIRTDKVIRYSFYSDNLLQTPTGTATYNKTHYALTFDNTTNKRYLILNANDWWSNIANMDFEGTGDFIIGKLVDIQPFNGTITNIKVFTKSLPLLSIKDKYKNKERGL